ncbi:MAG: peptide chain release factor N(5)-glutamine methyltransferase [Prevotella sp.]|nr:peptide chain release factor N(5)-glutamine methyltransferase [Prevotella sp.]
MKQENAWSFAGLWRRLTPLYDDGEARAIVRMVLEERFGFSSTDIFFGRAEQLNATEQQELELLMARLERAEPVQYVLGEAEFCKRKFSVNRHVLIPRPETQWMCESVSSWWGVTPREGHILDIGTGSGCIACTMALDLVPRPVEVVGWDLSEEALRVARINAARLGADVTFLQQDALNPPDDVQRWDIIVSNPPYVCEQERSQMASNVLDYEPAMALFVPDDDPLLFYRAIGRYAFRALKTDGQLLMEINAQLGDATVQLFREQGYADVQLYCDAYEKNRFVLASR